MSFWGEPGTRNVFRAAAVYAVVAWLLIQIADVVLPAFDFPAWALQTFLDLVVVGFFVTIVLAWVYALSPEDAYFSAGVHESILNSLSNIADLSVIARTSVLSCAEQERSIVDIGRELNVETVMKGSVQCSGDRVRITAQ